MCIIGKGIPCNPPKGIGIGISVGRGIVPGTEKYQNLFIQTIFFTHFNDKYIHIN